MFYVSGSKIYLTQFDETLKVYPEVILILEEDGTVTPEVLKTGIAKKPKNRSIRTIHEVLAALGHNAQPREKAPEPPKTPEQ